MKTDTQGSAKAAPAALPSTSAWREAQEGFAASGSAVAVLRTLTEATDVAVLNAWRASMEPLYSRSAALVAVGAYGRHETFPYSGADIIILFDRLDSPDANDASAEFARLLWIAGLRLNYTVRTVADCLDAHKHNVELAASLLDRRFLAGEASLLERLENRLPAVLNKQAHEIARHLSQAARLRHARYQNTCHHLEPDVKEFPGGLRDLRLVDRLTRLGDTEAPPALKDAAAAIWDARCYLHYRAGRDLNVLDHAAQDAMEGQTFLGGKPAHEWMRGYFASARVILSEARRALDAAERSESSLLDTFREQRTKLSNAEFTVSKERVLLRTPGQFESEPGMVLRLAEFIGRHGLPPAPETERRMEVVRPAFALWCSQSQASLWPALKLVLACPRADMALRALENGTLLPALFPEWGGIEDLPAADREQQYTVDEYALASIERVVELRSTADAARKRFAELWSEIEEPTLVLLALLFQQMPVLPLLPMADRERAQAEFLVEHRRDLWNAMAARDVDDPATVRTLAAQAGTVEHLKALTVFTYASIAALNPEAMTPWRLEQLWRTYSAVRDELTRELETDRIQQLPGSLSENADFLKGFPGRYLRAHTPAEIAMHIRLYELSRPTGVAVQLDEIGGAYRLTVVGRDRPSLFASFAGAISSFGLDIVKAEAFANASRTILDTFVFADPRRMLQQNPTEVERLEDLIRRVAMGRTDAQRLLRNRAPEGKNRGAMTMVKFDSEACETATLVEINTEDRPGLLYSLATVFSSNGCNIDVVLIDTKGKRAMDVFYVAYEGHKLSPEFQERLREKLIAAC